MTFFVRQHYKEKRKSLEYILSLPSAYAPQTGAWPVLCFLHGRGEGAKSRENESQPILKALTMHGPLRPGSSRQATDRFIVVAPQLLQSEKYEWDRYASAVRDIVEEVQKDYNGDYHGQTYLTGFSYGGDGVFDIALDQPSFWAALWAVDPTRVPKRNPGRPVWLSVGETSRGLQIPFEGLLGVQPATNHKNADFLYFDRKENHVGTARLVYQDDQIYTWLLTKHL